LRQWLLDFFEIAVKMSPYIIQDTPALHVPVEDDYPVWETWGPRKQEKNLREAIGEELFEALKEREVK